MQVPGCRVWFEQQEQTPPETRSARWCSTETAAFRPTPSARSDKTEGAGAPVGLLIGSIPWLVRCTSGPEGYRILPDQPRPFHRPTGNFFTEPRWSGRTARGSV